MASIYRMSSFANTSTLVQAIAVLSGGEVESEQPAITDTTRKNIAVKILIGVFRSGFAF